MVQFLGSTSLFRLEGLHSVLPLIDDPIEWVRHHVIGLLSNYGDDSVVDPLLRTLTEDADPGVRGQAAYSLGHIGSLRAIPHLIQAMENDKQVDELGHSPSSISATALDNLLGTHETRIRTADGMCTLPAKWPPDYRLLKDQALKLHAQWLRSSASSSLKQWHPDFHE